MSTEERDILALFEPRRPVHLTQAEAAELGSDALLEWRTAPEDGWIISVTDYVVLLRDGARWRRFIGAAVNLGIMLAGAAAITVVIVVLSLVFGTGR